MTARFDVTFNQHLRLDAERAWERLVDWEDHGRWVPFTRVVVHDEGSFTAYTGFGPLSLPDNMRVVSRDEEERCVRIEKTGPVLRGTAGFCVRASSDGGCVVTWEEHLIVPFTPQFAAPLLRAVTERLFRRALRAL